MRIVRKMKLILAEYGEWIFRIILFLAVCAQLYLTQSFVTRREFQDTVASIMSQIDRDKKENASAHLIIQTSVADMATTLKLMAASTSRLDDHEMRMRIVERNQIEVMTRLGMNKTPP